MSKLIGYRDKKSLLQEDFLNSLNFFYYIYNYLYVYFVLTQS